MRWRLTRSASARPENDHEFQGDARRFSNLPSKHAGVDRTFRFRSAPCLFPAHFVENRYTIVWIDHGDWALVEPFVVRHRVEYGRHTLSGGSACDPMGVPMQRTFPFAVALTIALGSCAPPADPPPPRTHPQERPADGRGAVVERSIDDLLALMRQRLLVQHGVARFKWHAHLPISDAKREQQLLEKVEDQARDLRLEPRFVRAFFQALMQAGKLVQQHDFESWRRGDSLPLDRGPDLMALRLEIDSLNRKLLQALQEADPSLSRERRKAVETRAEAVLQG